MVEQIVIWVLVGGVALLIGRRFHRALTGSGCGCGGGGCEQARSCVPENGVKPSPREGRDR